MPRPRHPKQDVEDAVQYAEELGWSWKKMGHWGRLFALKPIVVAAKSASTGRRPMPAITPSRSDALLTDARTSRRATMKTFEFTIVASGLDPSADDFETRFYEAGCNDATVSFQKGHIIVDFAREAVDVCDAFASAIEAVRAAGAAVDRLEPDPLVSLSDIASRSDMTRAAMTQYSKGQRGSGFPIPVAKVTSASPLWEWADVSRWLFANGKVERDVVIQAEAVRAANRMIACNDNFRFKLCHHVAQFEAVL